MLTAVFGLGLASVFFPSAGVMAKAAVAIHTPPHFAAPGKNGAAQSAAAEAGAGFEAKTDVFIGRREFGGAVRRDMAERAAKVASRLAAYEQAARLLAKDEDAVFILEGWKGDDISFDGLARLLFKTRITAIGAEGAASSQTAVAHTVLERPEDFRQRLVEALAEPGALEIHGQSLAGERALLARYDSLAPALLALPGLEQGGQEQLFVLQAIVNELSGLELFMEFFAERGKNQAETAEIKRVLERAELLAPANPLVLNALAELWLQLDRPLVALDYAGRAIAGNPDFARAHDTKGTILLRQRLSFMAAQSFGKAIDLAPRNAVYYMDRASAYLMLEETDLMCADLRRACALSECDGLVWAIDQRRCDKDAP